MIDAIEHKINQYASEIDKSIQDLSILLSS